MGKRDGKKIPPGPRSARPAASDGIAAASSSSSPYASVNDDAMQLEESIPASVRHPQHIDNLNAPSQPPLPSRAPINDDAMQLEESISASIRFPQEHIDNLNAPSQPLPSRASAVDSGVGIPSHFHQTHDHGSAPPPYFLFSPGAGRAAGPAGQPPHASKRTRRPSPPRPSESLLLGGNPASQQQQSLANTLLYMSQGASTSSTIQPLPFFTPGAHQQQEQQLNSTFTTINAENKSRDQVLLPRPQPLRSGPVPDSPAQGLHTKQTTGPHNGLINGYVPQALDSSAPLMVPPIGYQLPSRDDQKQGEIFIPHSNDIIIGGRGHETSVHPGNEKYRKLIDSVREAYWNSCKRDKPHVSSGIVRAVRAQNPPGRFLQRKDAKGLWFDVGDVKAREKTSHALREGISESKTSGGSKISIGKLHHHQANSKNNKVSRGEQESSAGDMEQDEHTGQQRIASLSTTNKNVATSSNSRRPSGSSVPGASAAGSSSDPTGRSEQSQATSSRGETRNKTASPSAAAKASEGHDHPASSAATCSGTGKRKRGRPPGSKTKKRHRRRYLIDGAASNPPPPTVLPPTKLFVPPISLPPFLPSPTTPDQFMNASTDRRMMVEVRHSSVANEERRIHARNFSGNRTLPLKQFLPPPMPHAAHDPRPLPPPAVTPKPTDTSDLELRLSFADHLTNSSCSGNLSEHLQQQRASTDRYLMAGLLGLDPSEVTEALGSGKTEEEVIEEHLKDAGEDRKHTSSDTGEKQKRRVVNAERLYAEISFTDPKKSLERRISKALFSIGFVKEKK